MALLKVNLFAAFLSAGLGWLIGGPVIAGLLAVLAVLVVLIWYNAAPEFVLKHLKAHTLTEASAGNMMHRLFVGDTNRLCMSAGMSRTRFSIIDTPLPMAFSMGASGSSGRVIVTTGLFKTLTRLEIAAVTAHELGHIKAGERVTTAMSLGMSIMATKLGLRGLLRFVSMGRLFGDAESQLTRLSKKVLRPDCRADAFAAQLCKDSAIMTSALQKLEHGVRSSNLSAIEGLPMIARLATVNPRDAIYASSHPEKSPMAHRVAELKRLSFAKAA